MYHVRYVSTGGFAGRSMRFALDSGTLSDGNESRPGLFNPTTHKRISPAGNTFADGLRLSGWEPAPDSAGAWAPRIAILVSLLCCFMPTLSSALNQTYFVDGSSIGPSLGTAADPFHTIQEAADILEEGDTAIVKGGSEAVPTLYAERVSFDSNSNSGTAPERITVRAEPRRSVIMYGFRTDDTDYLSIEGFQITIPEFVFADDWTARNAVYIRSDNVTVNDNYIFDVPGVGIGATSSEPWHIDGLITNNHLYRCGQGIVVYGNNWLIENNEVARLVRSESIGLDADYMRAFGNDITVRHNWLHGTLPAEIGSSHVDGLQTFTDNGWFLHNLVFEGNIVSDFGQGVIMSSGAGEGLVSDIVIRNNVFYGGTIGGSYGVLAKSGVTDLLVTHNLIANMEFHGVGLSEGAYGIVKNNIFYDAGSNYWAKDELAVDGGYNILNREHFPWYKEPTDLVNVDPLFVDPGNWLGADGIAFTEDDGYKLLPGSPAIGAAIEFGVTTDIFGSTRPQPAGCPPDIGPFEDAQGEEDCGGVSASTLHVVFYRDGDESSAFISIKSTQLNAQVIEIVYTSLNVDGVPTSQTSHFTLPANTGVSWRPVADVAAEGPLGRSVPNNEIIGPDGTNVSIAGSASITGFGLAGRYVQLFNSVSIFGSSSVQYAFAHALSN